MLINFTLAMLKPMPLNPTKVNQIQDFENFFGFCKVKVFCPDSVERPLLPVKYNGKTIFPTGKWVGVYLIEELKAVKKYIPQYQLEV